MSEHESAKVPDNAAVEALDRAAPGDGAVATLATARSTGAVAGIRRLRGGGGMKAPLARAAVRGLGNASVGRLLARKFVKQPPTDQERSAGEAAVRADEAKHAPLVSAARAKYNAQAAKLVGGMNPNWAKLKLDKVPEDVSKEEAPKFATITEQDVRDAFQAAWSSVFSVPIPGHALGTLVGQWKAEGGKTGIADFNLGNITYQTDPKDKSKATAAESDYRKRTAGEAQPSGQKVPKTAFYAVYRSLEQGAMGLLRRLMTGPNGGPPLLAALIYGTREEYVFVLKSYKYFSGPIRNIMITDRDGQQAIWWSGYLDSMSSVPEVNLPPTPPPVPEGTKPPDAPAEPGGGGEQAGPPAAPAPEAGPPPAPEPGGGAPEPAAPNPYPGQQEGGMSGDTGAP
jgi:hypothetical protein